VDEKGKTRRERGEVKEEKEVGEEKRNNREI